MIQYSSDLKEKIQSYYTDYYESTGLSGAQERGKARVQEDELEVRRMQSLEQTHAIHLRDYPKHLIVGTGTGGLAVALKQLGVDSIQGVEPNETALEICREKGAQLNLAPEAFQNAVAESLPFADDSFDFIHCFSVLEHVQDVPKALTEMYRVLKPGGLLHLQTPNYAFPYEGHYKIPAPTFLGKTITSAYMKALGKPSEFVSTLQFFSESHIDQLLKQTVDAYRRVYTQHSFERLLPQGKGLVPKVVRGTFLFWNKTLNISPYQEIIIQKFHHD